MASISKTQTVEQLLQKILDTFRPRYSFKINRASAIDLLRDRPSTHRDEESSACLLQRCVSGRSPVSSVHHVAANWTEILAHPKLAKPNRTSSPNSARRKAYSKSWLSRNTWKTTATAVDTRTAGERLIRTRTGFRRTVTVGCRLGSDGDRWRWEWKWRWLDSCGLLLSGLPRGGPSGLKCMNMIMRSGYPQSSLMHPSRIQRILCCLSQ